MPFRFRKSIKLGKGLKLNLSKSGISTSIGGRGTSINIGKRGVKTTVGIPGTGLSYSAQSKSPNSQSTQPSQTFQPQSPKRGAGCLSGLFGLITFPFRIAIDLIKSLINPQSRRSSWILVGGVAGFCILLSTATSLMSPSSTPTTTTVPSLAPTISISATNTPVTETTSTSVSMFQQVALADYPRVAASRFQTLQEATAELVTLHNAFNADHTLGQNADWHSQTATTLTRVITGANELASMTNYPAEYLVFHQEIKLLANEANSLNTNYLAALANQDMNALTLVTGNLGIIITHMNQAHVDLNALSITPTPVVTSTSIPTNIPTRAPTLIVFPTNPPATGGTCSCTGDALNCGDFSSHSSAQACYSYCISVGAGDIHGLDGNNDGSACDSLK